MPTRREILITSAASTALATKTAWAKPGAEPLKIGLTPVILTDQFAFLSRWGKYLSDQTEHPVSFVVRESYQSILDLLMGGQVNAAWICGYPYVLMQARLDLLSVPLYQGQPTYQAYLISALRQSGVIGGWANLEGKVLAYADPLSNSGWLVARAQMARAGIDHRKLRRTFFTYGHRNVADAVAAGLADAGAIDGYVWETMKTQRIETIDQTRIAWKSEPFGFPPIVTMKNTHHPATPALRRALSNMHLNATGQELLNALNLSGFTTGEPSLFESIRKLSRSL
jgi:phosphonate transport system substrate-binding protein|nr:PhnD/SsuA/transferrin family substrate-binding protein [Limnohabitans sp.]